MVVLPEHLLWHLAAPRLHQRGEIWWIDPDFVIASQPSEAALAGEIAKRRPAVVISSNAFLDQDVRIVVPFTSWQEKFDGLDFHYRIDADGTNNLGNDSSANLLQVRCVSVLRFDGYIGRLTITRNHKAWHDASQDTGVPRTFETNLSNN